MNQRRRLKILAHLLASRDSTSTLHPSAFLPRGVNYGRDHPPINASLVVYECVNFFIAALLYNMGRWHFLKAPIIHVRRLLASGQSIISQLSARASIPHEHLQRDLSITQIYDFSSSHSFRLAHSYSPSRPPARTWRILPLNAQRFINTPARISRISARNSK